MRREGNSRDQFARFSAAIEYLPRPAFAKGILKKIGSMKVIARILAQRMRRKPRGCLSVVVDLPQLHCDGRQNSIYEAIQKTKYERISLKLLLSISQGSSLD